MEVTIGKRELANYTFTAKNIKEGCIDFTKV